MTVEAGLAVWRLKELAVRRRRPAARERLQAQDLALVVAATLAHRPPGGPPNAISEREAEAILRDVVTALERAGITPPVLTVLLRNASPQLDLLGDGTRVRNTGSRAA